VTSDSSCSSSTAVIARLDNSTMSRRPLSGVTHKKEGIVGEGALCFAGCGRHGTVCGWICENMRPTPSRRVPSNAAKRVKETPSSELEEAAPGLRGTVLSEVLSEGVACCVYVAQCGAAAHTPCDVAANLVQIWCSVQRCSGLQHKMHRAPVGGRWVAWAAVVAGQAGDTCGVLIKEQPPIG
jgi:hypothetical protein